MGFPSLASALDSWSYCILYNKKKGWESELILLSPQNKSTVPWRMMADSSGDCHNLRQFKCESNLCVVLELLIQEHFLLLKPGCLLHGLGTPTSCHLLTHRCNGDSYLNEGMISRRHLSNEHLAYRFLRRQIKINVLAWPKCSLDLKLI